VQLSLIGEIGLSAFRLFSKAKTLQEPGRCQGWNRDDLPPNERLNRITGRCAMMCGKPWNEHQPWNEHGHHQAA
jgi:hypothetical protein